MRALKVPVMQGKKNKIVNIDVKGPHMVRVIQQQPLSLAIEEVGPEAMRVCT